MTYVDGFLIVCPKKKLRSYVAQAKRAGRVWRDRGALEYRECVGEDMKVRFGVPFPKRASAKAGDAVVFSWIVYKSRKHRDQVNAKVMADPRIAKMMKEPMPFEAEGMTYGGFDVVVDA